MDAIVGFFRDNWAVIEPAFGQFIALAFLGLTIGFTMGRFAFGERIETLKSRIEDRDEKIEDYRTKLSGASPDEAASRIVALEARLAAVEPRLLSSDQTAALAAVIAPHKIGVRIIRANSSVRLDHLFHQLRAIFHEHAWAVQDWVSMGEPKTPHPDITLGVAANVSPEAIEIVRSALRAARLDFFEQPITDDAGLNVPLIWLCSARDQRDATRTLPQP